METVPETVRKCSNASLAKWAAKHRWTVKCFRSLQISNVIQSAKCWLTPPNKVKCEIWAGFDWPPSDRNGTERLLKSASNFELISVRTSEFNNPTPSGIALLPLSIYIYIYVYLSLFLCLALLCYILSDGSSNMCLMPAYHSTCCCSVVVRLRTWESWQKQRVQEKKEMEQVIKEELINCKGGVANCPS